MDVFLSGEPMTEHVQRIFVPTANLEQKRFSLKSVGCAECQDLTHLTF